MSDFFTYGPDYGLLYAEPEASQYRALARRDPYSPHVQRFTKVPGAAVAVGDTVILFNAGIPCERYVVGLGPGTFRTTDEFNIIRGEN